MFRLRLLLFASLLFCSWLRLLLLLSLLDTLVLLLTLLLLFGLLPSGVVGPLLIHSLVPLLILLDPLAFLILPLIYPLLIALDLLLLSGLANSSGLVGRYMTGHAFIGAQIELDVQLFPGMNEQHSLISRKFFRCATDAPFARHDRWCYCSDDANLGFVVH